MCWAEGTVISSPAAMLRDAVRVEMVCRQWGQVLQFHLAEAVAALMTRGDGHQVLLASGQAAE
eukprot:630401-Heterocapsa_arctica.AAC.1